MGYVSPPASFAAEFSASADARVSHLRLRVRKWAVSPLLHLAGIAKSCRVADKSKRSIGGAYENTDEHRDAHWWVDVPRF